MNLPDVSTSLKVGKGVDLSRFTTYGAPIGAIAVSVLILLFVVWPKMSQAFKLRASNDELQVRVSALSEKVQVLSSLDKFQLDTQLGSAEALLPSQKEVFSFVRQIESIASRNGVILEKVDVTPGTLGSEAEPSAVPVVGEVEAAPKIEVKISTTSDYRSLLNFLSSLYSLDRVVGIVDLNVTSGSTSGGTSLNASMVVDAYWKPLPIELGSVESPIVTLTSSEEELLENVALFESTESAVPVAPVVPTGKSDLFSP